MEQTAQELSETQKLAREQQNEKVAQMERVEFLSNRLGAVEKEADASSTENQHLRATVSAILFSCQYYSQIIQTIQCG